MSFPLKPPREWFDAPEPPEPQPLRYENDGQVTGHLALWDQCHTGFLSSRLAECIRPPRSPDNYGSFHVGMIEAADGSEVPVGKITYDTSHAPMEATMQAASRHYDDTGSVGAFVRAHDGRAGIWLSGALRSDLPAEGLRDLRANPPSGDWRQLGRGLALVASLSVPVPGFPIRQMSLAASGFTAMILPGYIEEWDDELPEEDVVVEPRSKDFIRRRSLIAAALTTKRRNSLSRSSFAIPEDRAYPIHDQAHARNALARSAGKPEEGRVRRAVCRRYPSMGECAK